MKGIILAGGAGTRLSPLTKVTSKQLLPIYNKPMIYYPLDTLIKAGIKEILIIVAPAHTEDFMALLGDGKEFGVDFTYKIQDEPRGIAEAFILGEDFIDNGNVTLILGDNIFEDDFTESIKTFKSGGKIFVKEVSDPERFGVVEFDENMKVMSIEEKPQEPKSNFIQTGLYICDKSVKDKIRNLKPSNRGELEITDIMSLYLEEDSLEADLIKGEWFDTGTFESMFLASQFIRKRNEKKLCI